MSEEDYASSVAEWSKPSKNKKWYHLTSDLFVNLFHEREIAMAQEEAICEYRNSLVKGLGEHETKSFEVLIAKARAIVKAAKTRL